MGTSGSKFEAIVHAEPYARVTRTKGRIVEEMQTRMRMQGVRGAGKLTRSRGKRHQDEGRRGQPLARTCMATYFLVQKRGDEVEGARRGGQRGDKEKS